MLDSWMLQCLDGDECIDEMIDGRIGAQKWRDGLRVEGIDGRRNEWQDGWMDRWMSR